MVLKKSFRVLRRYKPRSVLLESKEIEGETLLFESNTIATLSEYLDIRAAGGCVASSASCSPQLLPRRRWSAETTARPWPPTVVWGSCRWRRETPFTTTWS